MQTAVGSRASPNWLVVVLLFVLPFASVAQSPQDGETNEPVEASPPVEEQPTIWVAAPCDTHQYKGDWIDRISNRLQKALCHTALWLDGVTGSDGDVLAARNTHGALQLTHLHSEYYGSKTRVRLDVRTDLPVLKRRLSAFAGLGDDEDIVKGRDESFAQRQQFRDRQRNNQWLAGLGYRLPSSRRYRSDFRVGLRGLSNPKIFVHNRYSFLAYAQNGRFLKLRETLFWTNQDSLGATTGIDMTLPLDKHVVFRWDSSGTYSGTSAGLDWHSAMIVYLNLLRGRGIAGEIFAHGETDHEVPVRDVGGRAYVNLPVTYDRLILQFSVGYSWPRSEARESREGSVNLSAGLELPFGS